MRVVLFGILMVMSLPASSAELWLSREGDCGEWRARWSVRQDEDGVWRGVTQHVMVGGSCNPETGARARSEVEATIAGESFFAARRHENGSLCGYFGRIRDGRVRGHELCEGSPARIPFAMLFSSGEERRDPQSAQERRREDWLDDPETYGRGRRSDGFEAEPGRR